MGEMGSACLVKHFNSQTNVKTKTMTKTKALFRECLERGGTGLFSYTIEEKNKQRQRQKQKYGSGRNLLMGEMGNN